MERQARQGQPVTLRKMISLPRLKRAVHKVMLRYGKSCFYRKIDLIHKVLKRLHQVQAPTTNEKCRIRSLINTWLAENDSSSSSDSEEEVEDRRLTRAQVTNVPLKIEPKNGPIEVSNGVTVKRIQPASSSNTNNDSNKHEIQVIKTVEKIKNKNVESEKEKQEGQRVEGQRKKRAENNLPPCPKAIPISSLKKTKPILVDLTMENEAESEVRKKENTKENKNTNKENIQVTKNSLETGLRDYAHQHKDKFLKTKRQRIEDSTEAKNNKEKKALEKDKNLGSSIDVRKTKVQEKHIISDDCKKKQKVKSVEIITIDDNEVFIKQELINDPVNTERESYQSTSGLSSEMSRMCFLAPYHQICHQNQIYCNADFNRHATDRSYVVVQVLPPRK